ncbi:SLOG family protein [Argonema antarcticum]|uniref:A1S_2505 family phage non-structural protein n=1 Tax=Argonema antarcticum TaxID=2942763 RepID=UPI00201265FB|nr:SLOG family protein [Argonema antarcticum]MCL1472048.1 SLOG family protein [Argonema antarcticum A004/B2]
MVNLAAAPNFIDIAKLSHHQIPVWGSNVGYHGAGVALQMFGESYKKELDKLFQRRGFGLQPGEKFKGLRAVYGQGRGYHQGKEGDSYAIETKSDWKRQRSTSLAEIGKEIDELIEFAKANSQLEFVCTPFGTGWAGYSHTDIANLWKGKDIPDNIRLPSQWLEELTKESKIPNFESRTRADLESLITSRQGNQVVDKVTGKQYGFVGRDSIRQAEKIYVGREFSRLGLQGSPLGNYEYRVKNHSLEEHNRAVTAYKSWFDKELIKGRKGKKSVAYQEVDRIADKLLQGKPIVLTCFCPKNLPCHARDVLEEAIIDRALEKQENFLISRSLAENNLSDVSSDEEVERQSNNRKRLFSPVNIYSKSPDWLAASLTNPTTVAEYWATKGQSGIKDKFPIFFGNKFWKDAEEAYQNFKQNCPIGPERDKLMASIVETKLNQYPELIKEIDKRGGSAWLETCEHRVNGGFWEGKGKDSPFISALIKAYERSSLRLYQKEADSTMTVAFSGSRAKYFKEHLDWEKQAKNSLKDMVKTAFDTAHSLNYDRLTFVMGMATGIDQWGAIEAIKLRKQQRQGLLPGIPKIEVLASLPCVGQEKVWNQREKDRYFKLLSLADDVHLVSREYYKSPAQLFERNDDMLNRLSGRDDMLLVVQVAGSRGTQDAIDKALAQGKEILLYQPDKKGTQSYTYFCDRAKSSTPPSSELAAKLMAIERKQTIVEQAQFSNSPRSQEVEL